MIATIHPSLSQPAAEYSKMGTCSSLLSDPTTKKVIGVFLQLLGLAAVGIAGSQYAFVYWGVSAAMFLSGVAPWQPPHTQVLFDEAISHGMASFVIHPAHLAITGVASIAIGAYIQWSATP